MQIGFIGFGHLGTPIAENLLEHHQGMLVYNRTVEKTKTLVEKGAVVAKNVAEVAAACDIVFTIVSNDNAVKEITEGDNGIAKLKSRRYSCFYEYHFASDLNLSF